MKNVVSFDVEDYFHVGAFADRIDRAQWDGFPSRVEANTKRILEMLAVAKSIGTFFVLGWVAEKFPSLVRSIADAGHEIACHSFAHRRIFEMSRDTFREDTRQAKQVIEDACGVRIRGYRAPSFSIIKESLWALEVLVESGFEYDSSIFPVKHPNYGMPNVPRFPFRIETLSGSLVEFPLTTVQAGKNRSPLAGGAYLRILPYWYLRWGLKYVNARENHPFCLYLHPWEMDSAQPRMQGSLTARLRHYVGLHGAESKLAHVLQDFEFQGMGSLIEGLKEQSSMQSFALSDVVQ